MICDALVEVNPYFKFVENINRPEEYMRYTDDLVKHIEVTKRHEFAGAQKILRRLHTRELYRCVGEVLLDHEKMRKME